MRLYESSISIMNLRINPERVQWHVQERRGIVENKLKERHDAGDKTSAGARIEKLEKAEPMISRGRV